MKRRHLLLTAAVCAAGVGGVSTLLAKGEKKTARTPISEHPYYRYLLDHDLRVAEKGIVHLDIDNVDFRNEEFINVNWQNFIFRNCYFPQIGMIQLESTAGCHFYNCEFGRGGKAVAMYFGESKNNRFFKCTFTDGNISFGEGKVYIQDSEFIGKPADPTSWNNFIGADDVEFVDCKFRYYDMTIGAKLNMRGCDYLSSGVSPISPREDYTADFIFEDTALGNARKFMWNNKINNLVLRGTRVVGGFSAQMSHVKDTLVVENIKAGMYHLNNCGPDNKLIVRGCYFGEVNEKTTHLFSCSGTYPIAFLMERVEGTAAGGVDLTGAGPGAPLPGFLAETTRNQTFTVRDCKIPILYINGLQTFNLLVENCEIGKLEMMDGRIGNLTIKNTRFNTLDLSRTLATYYDIDKISAKSGRMITDGSNYPIGGYEIQQQPS
jgi:hypothetical protein